MVILLLIVLPIIAILWAIFKIVAFIIWLIIVVCSWLVGVVF